MHPWYIYLYFVFHIFRVFVFVFDPKPDTHTTHTHNMHITHTHTANIGTIKLIGGVGRSGVTSSRVSRDSSFSVFIRCPH